jgi:hypothetical protein
LGSARSLAGCASRLRRSSPALLLLEDKQVATEAQFQETKRKLDMLDGKLDDRIGPTPTP